MKTVFFTLRLACAVLAFAAMSVTANAQSCTGMPNPGYLGGPASVSSGSTFALYDSINFFGTGVTYQWQASNDSVTWNAIAGATTTTLVTSQTSDTYYRVCATCSNSGMTACSNYYFVSTSGCISGSVAPSASVICAVTGSKVLTATGTTGAIQWQSSSDSITWTDISGATANTYVVTNLTAGTTKYYRVLTTGTTCVTNTAVVTTSVTPTVIATSILSNHVTIQFSPYGWAQFTVSWNGAGTGSQGNVTSNTFTMSSLTPGQPLNVCVTQTSGACAGASAGCITVTTLCSPVTGVSLTSPADSTIKVTWNPVFGATAYRVYYQDTTAGIGWTYVDTVTGANPPSKILYPVNSCDQYNVRVARLDCPTAGVLGQQSSVSSILVSPCSGCTGSPNAGVASGPALVNTGQTFTLADSGYSTGNGIAMQWRKSSNNVNWTDIPGATNAMYTDSISTNTYYHLCVTCTYSNVTVCSNSVYVSVPCSGGLTILGSTISSSCSASNGSISTVVTGGVSPFSYQWSNGANQPNLLAVGSGSYCLTITDANGCSGSNCWAVYQNGIYVNPYQIPDSITGGTDVALYVISGTPPYQYAWNTGATTSVISNVSPGTYCGTVTDANGCTADTCTTVSNGNVTIAVTGQLINTSGAAVTVFIVTDAGSQTATTNASGSFTHIVAANNYVDPIVVYFVNCNNVQVNDTLYATGGSANFSADYCPPLNGTLFGHLSNTSSIPVQVFVTEGPSWLTMFTDSLGNFQAPLFGTDSVDISFINCNGNGVDTIITLTPADTVVNYIGSYCSIVPLSLAINGTVSNVDSLTIVSIQVQTDLSTGSWFYADSNPFGTYGIQVPVSSYADPVTIEFGDCNGTVHDTVIIPNANTLTYNFNFCPSNTVICDTLFHTTYCTCDTAFTLIMDSATQAFGGPYLWDFGDGVVDSINEFPVHTYATNGIYTVCLTVLNPLGAFCNYCHDIGIDSAGNVHTRVDQTGFIIKVVPYGTSGIKQLPNEAFDIYPNPVGDNGMINFYSDHTQRYDINLYNTVGQRVRTFSVNAHTGRNTAALPLHELSNGLYLMTMQFGSKQVSKTFVK